ncbi:MAG TPA: hypothetical protein PKH07_07980, partial [bacterium]|nr:hypothetical protein [bacterium]
AIPLDSSLFSSASLELGRLLIRLERWNEASAVLQQVAWIPLEATATVGQLPLPLQRQRALSPDAVQSSILLAQAYLHLKKTSDASNTLGGLLKSSWQFLPEDKARIHLLLGHCFSQLGSLDKAQKEYEASMAAQDETTRQKARFYLAEMLFWHGEIKQAQQAYREILEGDYSRECVNDVLRRLALYTVTSEDGLKKYAQADFFAWQGRLDDAVNGFREIAAKHSGSDLSVWALLRAAEIQQESGKAEVARVEYERLLTMTENVTLLGSIQMKLASTAQESQTLNKKMEEIVLQVPDSIFADLARLRLQELTTPTALPAN